MWQGGIMLSYILMTAMCMKLLHVQHLHLLTLPHNVVHSSSYSVSLADTKVQKKGGSVMKTKMTKQPNPGKGTKHQ